MFDRAMMRQQLLAGYMKPLMQSCQSLLILQLSHIIHMQSVMLQSF